MDPPPTFFSNRKVTPYWKAYLKLITNVSSVFQNFGLDGKKLKCTLSVKKLVYLEKN